MRRKAWTSWLLAGLVAFSPSAMVTADVLSATAPAISPVETAEESPSEQILLDRQTARREMMLLPAIVQARRSEQEAFDAWHFAMRRAENLDTEKVTFTNPFTGQEESRSFDDKTQLRLRMQKYLEPDQRKLSYEMASKTTSITISNMENSMDGLLMTVWSAQSEVDARMLSLKLAEEALSRAKATRLAGNITDMAVDEAQLELRRAEINLAAAVRTLENQQRNLNQFLGASLARNVAVALTPAFLMPVMGADDYVLQALQNRMEPSRLRSTIQLLEVQLELLTFRDVYLYDMDLAAEHERTRLNLEQTRLDLEESLRNITAEVRAAYARLQLGLLDVEMSVDNLQRQRDQLVAIRARIASGRLPAWSQDALEAAIPNLERANDMTSLSLNLDVNRFRQATQAGPGMSGR